MKRYLFILLLIGSIIPACSQLEKEESILDDFIGHYDLPSDVNSAFKYIADNDEIDRRLAYEQLIVENSEIFDNDVNFIKHPDFPGYYSPIDRSFRIYSFILGMHHDPQILQHKNSKGKVITSVLTTVPLDKMLKGETPSSDDYNMGWTNIADHLATVQIDGVPTHILYIAVPANPYENPSYDEICGYVAGIQLTDDGYKFVPIFRNEPCIGIIRSTDTDIERVKGEPCNNVVVRHGETWYNPRNNTLGVPLSVENTAELFATYRWNDEIERFEELMCLTNDIHPDVSDKLGYNYGMEVVMCFQDLIVRVDHASPRDEVAQKFMYSAWGNGETMSQDPDIIIHGGTLNEHNGTISFAHDGYEYIVPCADNKHSNSLVIKRNSKIVKTIEVSGSYSCNRD